MGWPHRHFLPIALLLCSSVAFGRTPPPATAEVVHQVFPGQTLGSIAKRYSISIDALCRANGISRKRPIAPGQKLLIPGSLKNAQPKATTATSSNGTAVSGSPKPAARRTDATEPEKASPVSSFKVKPSRNPKWQDYKHSVARSGYVTLDGTAANFSGYVLLKGGRISPSARLGIRQVLASWRTGKQIDTPERLIRLLVKVSDTFGGRPLRIVGGFREHSFARDSKHISGHAVDFSVPGLPNTLLVEYLKTLPDVGVGYYPNSSFVHLDIRDRSTYWVDYSGPGERPRYAGMPGSSSTSD